MEIPTMQLVYNYPSQFRIKTTALLKRLWKALATFFSNIGKSIVKGQQARADFWILNNMSDKALKDIGVTRGEIKQKFNQKD
mgnify:CR=1 FL=1|jgi:uncharacterized protein YjiS (DUF1127 family)